MTMPSNMITNDIDCNNGDNNSTGYIGNNIINNCNNQHTNGLFGIYSNPSLVGPSVVDSDINYKQKYRLLKVKLKALLYENQLFDNELTKLNRELIDIYRDKEKLLEKLFLIEDSPDDDSSSSDPESIENQEDCSDIKSVVRSGPINIKTNVNDTGDERDCYNFAIHENFSVNPLSIPVAEQSGQLNQISRNPGSSQVEESGMNNIFNIFTKPNDKQSAPNSSTTSIIATKPPPKPRSRAKPKAPIKDQKVDDNSSSFSPPSVEENKPKPKPPAKTPKPRNTNPKPANKTTKQLSMNSNLNAKSKDSDSTTSISEVTAPVTKVNPKPPRKRPAPGASKKKNQSTSTIEAPQSIIGQCTGLPDNHFIPDSNHQQTHIFEIKMDAQQSPQTSNSPSNTIAFQQQALTPQSQTSTIQDLQVPEHQGYIQLHQPQPQYRVLTQHQLQQHLMSQQQMAQQVPGQPLQDVTIQSGHEQIILHHQTQLEQQQPQQQQPDQLHHQIQLRTPIHEFQYQHPQQIIAQQIPAGLTDLKPLSEVKETPDYDMEILNYLQF